MQTANRRLLLIGPDETHCEPLARALRLLWTVETRALGPADSGPPTVLHAVVVTGIALRKEETIHRMRRTLQPFLDQAIPILCLLDMPSTRDDVQARAVGASAVLPSTSSSRRVSRFLRDLMGEAPAARLATDLAATTAAVQEVGLMLADLMRSAALGQGVDHDMSTEAAALLMQAIAMAGIARWMETVVSIHDQTYRHSLLMAGIAAAFVLALGFNADDCHRLTRAAILHDIGKSLVPVEIMNKPGRLTADEMAIIRCHPVLGHELLLSQGGHHPTTLMVVRHHHEYLDGSGYPNGLTADQIPDEVRIATICDVFAALIEVRSYKPSLSAVEAFTLMKPMGGKLDIHLLAAFRRIFVP